MGTISFPSCQIYHSNHKSLQFHLSVSNPSIISFPYHYPSFSAFKTPNAVGKGAFSAVDLLKKPTAEVAKENGRGEDSWLDWEDRILEDTVPLVGFVRMILHSGKYESGDRLSSEHESMILQRLLVHHPESDKKIGSGIDYVMVGHHPDFDSSRCLFIVRKNGEMVDFSYWKCIKGLIKKKYPLYADSFILQHFRRRKIID